MKPLLTVLGALAALGIVGQLVMGQLILQGHALQKAHQHSGYLTVVIALVYIVLSMMYIQSNKMPTNA